MTQTDWSNRVQVSSVFIMSRKVNFERTFTLDHWTKLSIITIYNMCRGKVRSGFMADKPPPPSWRSHHVNWFTSFVLPGGGFRIFEENLGCSWYFESFRRFQRNPRSFVVKRFSVCEHEESEEEGDVSGGLWVIQPGLWLDQSLVWLSSSSLSVLCSVSSGPAAAAPD